MILTSLDPAIVGAGEVVKAYFERWPQEELQFRSMKKVACLNRVAGYGKKQQDDTNVLEKQKVLQEKIGALKKTLAEPSAAIEEEEAAIAKLVREERKLRGISRIEEGRRILPAKQQERFEEIGREILKRERAVRKIKEPQKNQFNRLRKSTREWLRLQGKETVYTVDVELDQIMTFYRMSLVNIYSYLSYELLGGSPMSMNTLVHAVLHMPAVVEETQETKSVRLKYDEKNPEMMERLQGAIGRIHRLGPKTLEGKKVLFSLGDIDSHLVSGK